MQFSLSYLRRRLGHLKLWGVLSLIVSVLILSLSFTYMVSYSTIGCDCSNVGTDYRSEHFMQSYEAAVNDSPVVPAGVTSYVSVEVDNYQYIPTPVPFDLKVKIGSYALSAYESRTLGNVVWFSLNGSIIPSWIQCNANSSSSCTLYWLRLDFSIPGNSSLPVFMGFDNTSVSNFAGTDSLEGEAPQLSSIYGEYDNGHLIFPLYCNFSGTNLPSSWTCYANRTAKVSVDNGLIIQDSFNDAYAYAVLTDPIEQNEIIESLVTEANVTAGYPTTQGIGLSTTTVLTNHLVYYGTPYDYYFENGLEADLYHAGTGPNQLIPNADSSQIYSAINFTGYSYMVGIDWLNSTQYWYLDGNTVLVSHNSSVLFGSYYPSAGMTSGGAGAGVLKIQYIRGRYFPPNNVMPEVSGEYVVSDLGCVRFTASGIPYQVPWYLNISNYPFLVESGSRSTCVKLPAGFYYYTVSTSYQGIKYAAAGTFTVSSRASTYVLVVFPVNLGVSSKPNRSSPLLPPEIYIIISEILILAAGAIVILISNRKRFNSR